MSHYIENVSVSLSREILPVLPQVKQRPVLIICVVPRAISQAALEQYMRYLRRVRVEKGGQTWPSVRTHDRTPYLLQGPGLLLLRRPGHTSAHSTPGRCQSMLRVREIMH